MITELLDDDLQTTDTETSIELNFAVLKFKHTIKKKNKWELYVRCNRNPRRIRPALLADEGDPKPNSGIVATFRKRFRPPGFLKINGLYSLFKILTPEIAYWIVESGENVLVNKKDIAVDMEI